MPGPAPAAFLIRDRGALPDGCRRVARKRERGAEGKYGTRSPRDPNPQSQTPFGSSRLRQIAKDIGLTMAEFLRRGGDDQSRSVTLRMRGGRAGFRVECRSDWLKENKGWVHRVTQHPKPDSVRLRGEPDAAGRVGRRDMQRVAVGHKMAEERDTARCGRRPLGAAQDLAARIACSSANKRAARSGSRASALVFSSGSISKLKR